MPASLQQARSCSYTLRQLFFAGALALAAAGAPAQAPAQTTTVCKRTIPPGPGPSFTFVGRNSWPTTSPKSFGQAYTGQLLPPNPPGHFNLQDGGCETFNIAGQDKFNRFTETTPPPGWTLTNISCIFTTSVVTIIGSNANPAFQPGDNTVTIDQTEPNVTCTFVNTCSFKPRNLSTGTAGWLVTRPSGTTAPAHAIPPYGPWANHAPPAVGGPPFPPGTSWVQPASSSVAVNEHSGTYIYQRRFEIPCPGTVDGWFAADNAGTLEFDGDPSTTVQCLGNPSQCFAQQNVTSFSQAVAAGTHLIKFTVTNQAPGSSRTGLLAHITVH